MYVVLKAVIKPCYINQKWLVKLSEMYAKTQILLLMHDLKKLPKYS